MATIIWIGSLFKKKGSNNNTKKEKRKKANKKKKQQIPEKQRPEDPERYEITEKQQQNKQERIELEERQRLKEQTLEEPRIKQIRGEKKMKDFSLYRQKMDTLERKKKEQSRDTAEHWMKKIGKNLEEPQRIEKKRLEEQKPKERRTRSLIIGYGDKPNLQFCSLPRKIEKGNQQEKNIKQSRMPEEQLQLSGREMPQHHGNTYLNPKDAPHNPETVHKKRSEFQEEDATAQVSCIEDSYDEFEEPTWFEKYFMDENNLDLNETTRNVMDCISWIGTYGLAWPNEKLDDFHLVLYVKQEETRPDYELVQDLSKTLEQNIVMHGTKSKIENWVEFRKQTKNVQVKFLADAEPNNEVNEVEKVAQPGINVLVDDIDEENPLTTAETSKELYGDAVTKRATLTAICHSGESNFALTCFHLLCRNSRGITVPNIELVKKEFSRYRDAAQRPNHKQRMTEYQYDCGSRVDRYKKLGSHLMGLFDEEQDILLISIPADVEFSCAIESYSGEWGITRKDFNKSMRNKKTKKKKQLRNEVVRIAANGQRRGRIDHSGRSKTMPFTGMHYMVLSTDPAEPFIQVGDSGSIVCMVTTENKFKPFAYCVCETDLGTDGSLNLCLDLKTAIKNLQEALGSPLEPCFDECLRGAVAHD